MIRNEGQVASNNTQLRRRTVQGWQFTVTATRLTLAAETHPQVMAKHARLENPWGSRTKAEEVIPSGPSLSTFSNLIIPIQQVFEIEFRKRAFGAPHSSVKIRATLQH